MSDLEQAGDLIEKWKEAAGDRFDGASLDKYWYRRDCRFVVRVEWRVESESTTYLHSYRQEHNDSAVAAVVAAIANTPWPMEALDD